MFMYVFPLVMLFFFSGLFFVLQKGENLVYCFCWGSFLQKFLVWEGFVDEQNLQVGLE